MKNIPIISLADEVAVTASSATFATLVMDVTQPIGARLYRFTSSVACWIAQGASPTASAGAGSIFVPSGVEVVLDGRDGAALAVIRDVSDGKASLAPLLHGL